MPKIVYPRSDQDRIYLLDKCIATAKSNLNQAQQTLNLEMIQKLENFLNTYESEYSKTSEASVDLLKETREKNKTLTELDLIVRDFFEVLRRRRRRKNHPKEIYTLFGLHLNGHNPKLTRHTEIISAAQSIVTGDKNAVQKGYPPMLNPSVEEVEEILNIAEKEFYEVAPADRILAGQQKKLRSFRNEADKLIRETALVIRFALRNNTPSNQRRIMKLYGFRYRYSKHEKVEEDKNSKVD